MALEEEFRERQTNYLEQRQDQLARKRDKNARRHRNRAPLNPDEQQELEIIQRILAERIAAEQDRVRLQAQELISTEPTPDLIDPLHNSLASAA